MSEKLIPILHRMEATDPLLDAAWVARIKYALSLPGCSASGEGLAIMCHTCHGRHSGPLLLPNGGTEFATLAARNAVMERLNLASG